MAQIKAFRALRFTENAGDTAFAVCPPYDIISEEEKKQYLAQSRFNIIRLEKPEGDNAYENAAETLKQWIGSGVLAEDAKDGFYIYEEEFSVEGEVKKFRGIFTLSKLYDFSEKVVLPHEETLSKAKNDRFNLMSSTFCNFSPIYSMYHDNNSYISSLIHKASSTKPEIEFADKTGVIQRLWIVNDSETVLAIEKAFEDKQLFIADGHHRYETALNFRNKLKDDGIIKDENHKGNFVMMFLVDMENEGLVVFPTHRMIHSVENFDKQNILSKIEVLFNAEKICKCDIRKALQEKSSDNAFVFCIGEEKYLLTPKDKKMIDSEMERLCPGKSEAYKSLDVSVLHSVILEEIMGIDREKLAGQINLTYTRDENEATEGAESGKYQCSFILNPTKVSQIRDVALANDKMPQKSTYFYPKLITGLVMNRIKPLD